MFRTMTRFSNHPLWQVVARGGLTVLTVSLLLLMVSRLTGLSTASGSITGRNSSKDPMAGPPGTGDRPVEIVEEGADYRLICHAAGITRVPRHPKRICALSAADELLAIGLKPVAHSINDGNFPDYLAETLSDVPWIPNVYGAQMPNLEAVVRVRPDLIITRNTNRQTYLQLSRIAPVVVMLDHLRHYRQRLLDVGTVVGREQQAGARLAWYNAKVDAANAVLHPIIGAKSMAVMVVRPRVYRLFGDQNHVSPLLYGDLKMVRPDLVKNRTWSSTMSPEQLLKFDADYLLLAVDSATEGSRTFTALREHAVWKRVPAIQNERTLIIPKWRHWSDSGILGRALCIDDVLRLVAPQAIASVDLRAEQARSRWRP
jgi:iron complex transport system substrate-binding protein